MKRYVKLFESYLREYNELDPRDIPEGMGGMRGRRSGRMESSSESPVEMAHDIADELGINHSDLDANLRVFGVEGEEPDTYGVYPLMDGIGILVGVTCALIAASFIGAKIEVTIRNRRWMKQEVKDRLETARQEMPDTDEKTLVETVVDDINNDSEFQRRLSNWSQDLTSEY